MMSKERELLKRFMTELKTEDDVVSLFNDIKECLALPEQTEQEPVAWMNESGGCFLSDGNKYSDLWTPLYTAPPKREPLSDEEMMAIWKEGIRGEIPFVEIGRAIEKAHGIGGEE
jgi:hypothetical protein